MNPTYVVGTSKTLITIQPPSSLVDGVWTLKQSLVPSLETAMGNRSKRAGSYFAITYLTIVLPHPWEPLNP
jgi:hypothetical protein